MTAKEIYTLRKSGKLEEAYEAARQLYATDKSPAASSTMFWAAVDILKVRLDQGRRQEASKILMALERLLPHVPDTEGWVRNAYERSERMLQKPGNDVSDHNELGKWGEELAAAYLSEEGYVILDRDWHSGHRDIDIVASQDGVIVFVEVKTRRNTDYALPEEAVNYAKRRNLRYAINHYLQYRHVSAPYRFDIITVVGSYGCTHPHIDHICDVNIVE